MFRLNIILAVLIIFILFNISILVSRKLLSSKYPLFNHEIIDRNIRLSSCTKKSLIFNKSSNPIWDQYNMEKYDNLNNTIQCDYIKMKEVKLSSIIAYQQHESIYTKESTDQMKKRNFKQRILFASAVSYKASILNNFVKTLYKTGYNGDAFYMVHSDVYFGGTQFMDLISLISQHHGTFMYIDDMWPYYCIFNEVTLRKKTLEKTISKHGNSGRFKYAVLRYMIMYAFILDYGHNDTIYLNLDARDIFFIHNPFSWNIPRGVSLFEEGRRFENNGQSGFYRPFPWYNRKILNTYIINSGQIYMTYPESIPILNEFVTYMNQATSSNLAEQPIFNLLYYQSHICDNICHLYYNFFGPVRFLYPRSYLSDEDDQFGRTYKSRMKSVITLDKDNNILNYDYTKVLFVHLYTQCQIFDLQKHIQTYYM